ncbi:MAG: methionine gamma-lyase family protein [Armatimonadetes bacterium]|nr:methionine gamma-lyase family protein [Armatimonadota bacterium]
MDLGVSPERIRLTREGEEATAEIRRAARRRAAANQWRVLDALQSCGLCEGHFGGTTGYGFGDSGREALDHAVARIFGAESGRVRHQIVSGTHAISAALFGNLLPGQVLVSLTGAPYDTLAPVLGHPAPAPGSLAELGIGFRQLELTSEGRPDVPGIPGVLDEQVGMVFLQRSRGYTWRPSLSVGELEQAIQTVRGLAPRALILVDNCYGELVEAREPTHAGADLVAGSLIKNLGGSLCPTGGYLAGKASAVERAMIRLTAPGIGPEEGPTLGFSRTLAQGLFFAPHIVGQALEGAIWAAWVLEQAGYEVSPRWDEPRTDIIQAVRFGSREGQQAFCRGVQRAGPVDCRAVPTPVMNPGYRDPILMAGGTFIQGSSIELSADGPLRPPHACYLQGGISLAHVQLGVLRALEELDRIFAPA